MRAGYEAGEAVGGSGGFGGARARLAIPSLERHEPAADEVLDEPIRQRLRRAEVQAAFRPPVAGEGGGVALEQVIVDRVDAAMALPRRIREQEPVAELERGH